VISPMSDRTDAFDIPGDVTWMSYAELGRSRGISTASAKRLSDRRRWSKQAGNDGTTRVAVPVAEAVARETDAGDISRDASRLIAEANARADAAIALADRTLTQLAEAHAENGKLRDRLEQARQQVEMLWEADTTRRGQGRWARLRQAWRGE
jgi:hypothetical protein